jgi:hypothetical protein
MLWSLDKVIMRLLLAPLCVALITLSACSADNDNAHTTATTIIAPSPTQILTVIPRPQSIVDLMEEHAVHDDGKPFLKILSPAPGAVVNNPKVVVKLSVGRNFGGVMKIRSAQSAPPHVVAQETAGFLEGQIAVILDGHLCRANIDPEIPLEMRNLSPGEHTVQAFVLRSSGESYKNATAFQSISFTVTGPGYIAQPKPTDQDAVLTGQYQCLGPAPGFVPVELNKPHLVLSQPLPNLEIPGTMMLDFWLVNAKLKGDGGEYRVRYFIDDDDARYIDKWEPIWLSGWTPGKHSVRVELLGADQYPVPNGITTQEITVIK